MLPISEMQKAGLFMGPVSLEMVWNIRIHSREVNEDAFSAEGVNLPFIWWVDGRVKQLLFGLH